jgi:hypothetical protein
VPVEVVATPGVLHKRALVKVHLGELDDARLAVQQFWWKGSVGGQGKERHVNTLLL